MSARDLLTALDAHRPGESIVDDPALGDVARRLETDADARRLRERIEHADRRIAASLHAVEPPEGLAARLLARLAETPVVAGRECSAAANDVAVELNRAVLPASSGKQWRRRAFLASGVAAAAAAVMLTIHFWPKPEQPWTADQVLEAAIALYTRDVRTGGRPLAEVPENLPPSDGLVHLPPNTLWRRIDDTLAGSDAVAYDIELFPGGPRATQYAFSPSAQVTGLPDAPPPMPATPTTQGVCAAAWEHRGVVYVLVVEGGPREYRQFLRNKGGVFAGRRLKIEDRGLRG